MRFIKTKEIVYFGKSPVYIGLEGTNVWLWNKRSGEWDSLEDRGAQFQDCFWHISEAIFGSPEVDKLEILVVTGTTGPKGNKE